jgi:F-type H+-transporting ATPase subunit epsilon
VPDGEHTFHTRVLTPEGEVFEGEVRQLSTRTAVGEIGVLANHAPVLARVRPSDLRLHLPDGKTLHYAQAEGWLEVFANKALLLVGEATEPDRLDPGELRERLADADRRLEEAEEGSAAQQQAEIDKARAEAFLEVAGE